MQKGLRQTIVSTILVVGVSACSPPAKHRGEALTAVSPCAVDRQGRWLTCEESVWSKRPPADESMEIDLLPLADPPGGALRVLTDPVLGFRPVWSPNRKRILLSFHATDDYEACRLSILNPRNGALRHQTGNSEWSCPEPSDWSPDGQWLVGTWWSHDAANNLFITKRNGTRDESLTSYWHEGQYGTYGAWMNNGRIVYEGHAAEPSGIYSVNPDGSDTKLLLTTPFIYDLVRGPGRGRVVFAVSDGREKVTPEEELFVMHADGSHRRQITTNLRDELGAVWSPDGTKLAVVIGDRYRDSGRRQIWVYETTTWKAIRVIAPQDQTLTSWPPPVWSPDSRWLAYIGATRVQGSRKKAVFAARVDAGEITQVTRYQEVWALLEWIESEPPWVRQPL